MILNVFDIIGLFENFILNNKLSNEVVKSFNKRYKSLFLYIEFIFLVNLLFEILYFILL